MKDQLKRCFLALIALLFIAGAQAQDKHTWAIKTNLLYDATLTANLGVEKKIAPKWSLDLSANMNAWTINNRLMRQWMLQPEARYWLCEAMGGHFFAAHLLGDEYNMGNLNLNFNMLGTDLKKLKDHRYEGWYAGLGVAYGYSWMITPHFNIEAEIGLGWIYTKYDAYPCTECGRKLESGKTHNYVGPTKAAINLVYVF